MLIGLNGRKRAGKDTVYERVAWLMRDVVPVERASFADLLYRSAAAALGVTVEFLQAAKADPDATVVAFCDGVEPAETTITVREYLQRYGTEAHREIFGDNFWVEQVAAQLARHDGRVVLVTDVRFPNEAEAVRAAGGAVVEVVGPMGRVTYDTHASEAPLPAHLIDATITNVVRDDNFRALDGQIDTLFRIGLAGSLRDEPC